MNLSGRVLRLFLEMRKSLAGGVLARGEDRKGKEGSRFSLGAQTGGWTPKWYQSAAGVPDP